MDFLLATGLHAPFNDYTLPSGVYCTSKYLLVRPPRVRLTADTRSLPLTPSLFGYLIPR